MQTLPHRLYSDEAGNILELTVSPIASLVVEQLYGHWVVIGLRYQSGEWEEQTYATYILRSNGEVREIYNQLGEIEIGIEYDLFYMILNPINLNGWQMKDIKENQKARKKMASQMGMRLEDVAQPHLELIRVVDETREAYIRSLSDRRGL